jgi:hypothetical protein
MRMRYNYLAYGSVACSLARAIKFCDCRSKIIMMWMLLIMILCEVGVEGRYSARIVTEPSQGPFRIGRTVQFSCLIEPTPPELVTYQWRAVEYLYGSSSYTQQNLNVSYWRYSFHYCYYYCEVSMNETLLDSVSRIVQIQGTHTL